MDPSPQADPNASADATPRRRRLWLGVQAGLSVLAAVAGYFSVMGFDAPGGFMSTSSVPWVIQAQAHVWVLSTVGFFVAARWARSIPWTLAWIAASFGLFVALYSAEVSERLSAPGWETACAADEPSACFALAGLYWRGAGVARDAERASELDAQACALDLSAACVRLARDADEAWRESACERLRVRCKEGQRRDCDALSEHCGRPR